jgi:putative ABC transport system substrate-binding protein
MRRREFVIGVGLTGAALRRPILARAQQQAMPVIGVVSGQPPQSDARNAAPFYKGLSEAGYVDGQSVTVEYHWMEGHYDRLPGVMADLARRRVAVIATTGNNATALAAKAATTTIPIVFAVGQDPVKLGLVASLNRPGGNATGVNDFLSEVDAKRLRLLHDMVPKAVRVAVLINPANVASAEGALAGTKEAAAAMGLQLRGRRYAIARSQRDELCGAGRKKCIGGNKEGIGAVLGKTSKGRIDLANCRGVQDSRTDELRSGLG